MRLAAAFIPVLALALGACSHSKGAELATSPAVAPNGVKHMARPIEVAPGLEGSSVPAVFEQVFCSAMFERNDKQVVCPDQIRAFVAYQRERGAATGESMSIEEIAKAFETPRDVILSAGLSGDVVLVNAAVVDRSGNALGRFQVKLAHDGADVTERAAELAAQVVALPK
ncbi:MAG: hypothetical protein ACOX6T_08625 [Myxococcales bacterium]|jgi:hypothetical protein